MRPRVNIVGRGIVGLSCAFRFAQAGYSVCVIAPHELIASEVATGISLLKGQAQGRDLLFRLKIKGHKQFAEQLATMQPYGAVYGRGVHEPFFDENDFKAQVLRVNNKVPLASITELVARSTEASRPKLISRLNVAGTIYHEDDLWCDSTALLQALSTACRSLGVDFIDDEVNLFVASPLTNECYRCIGSKSVYESKYLVIAAGFRCVELCARSGINIDGFKEFPGEVAIFPTSKPENCALTRGKFAFIHSNGGMKVAPWQSASLSNLNSSESLLNRIVDSKILSTDQKRLNSGVRLKARKMLPVVGQLRLDKIDQIKHGGIWMVTAMYKSGYQLADFIACNLVLQVSRANDAALDPDYLELLATAQRNYSFLKGD